MLWSCGWLNKHISLTCSSARLLVTAVQDATDRQAATNPSFDCQKTHESSPVRHHERHPPSLPVTVNEQHKKTGTVAAVVDGIAVLPARTRSHVAFPRGTAIGDIIFVKPAVRSWRQLTQARQHSFTASEELHQPRPTAPRLPRETCIKFHHSFSFKGRGLCKQEAGCPLPCPAPLFI